MLRALTRKMALDPSADLSRLASTCSPYLTGADLYALCADAWQRAALRAVAPLAAAAPPADPATACDADLRRLSCPITAAGTGCSPDGGSCGPGGPGGPEAPSPRVLVGWDDLVAARDGLTPSVTPDTLAEYERIKARYSSPAA